MGGGQSGNEAQQIIKDDRWQGVATRLAKCPFFFRRDENIWTKISKSIQIMRDEAEQIYQVRTSSGRVLPQNS